MNYIYEQEHASTDLVESLKGIFPFIKISLF